MCVCACVRAQVWAGVCVSLWLEDMCRCDGSKRVFGRLHGSRRGLSDWRSERPGSAGAGAQRHLPGGSSNAALQVRPDLDLWPLTPRSIDTYRNLQRFSHYLSLWLCQNKSGLPDLHNKTHPVCVIICHSWHYLALLTSLVYCTQ